MKKIICVLLCFLMTSNVMTVLAASKLTFVTEPLWDNVSYYSEGLMAVNTDGKTGFVDKKGKMVIAPFNPMNMFALPTMKYQEVRYLIGKGNEFKVGDFHEGLAYISLGSSAYNMYINQKGKIVYSMEDIEKILEGNSFPSKKSFSEGIAGGSPFQGKHRYITRDGRLHEIKNPYDSMDVKDSEYKTMVFTNGLFREGLTVAAFQNKDEEVLFGYIDAESKLKIEPKFQDAKPFSDGVAFVKYNDNWGVINKKGKFVVEPLYSNYMVSDMDYQNTSLKEGLFVVKKGDYWGAVNSNGRVVVDFLWDSMNLYSEGYAVVRRDNKFGYVNKYGTLVIPCKYSDANPFNNGTALVAEGNRYKFIDTKGSNASNDSWVMEGSVVDPSDPEIILYRRDGKWGVAKVDYTSGNSN